MHGLDIAFFFVLVLDKNIIQIYNNKDIKFFCKDLIDIALEYYRSLDQSKKHYLLPKIIVSGPENCFSLIFFANSHPVIGTCEIELGKLPSLQQSI